MRPSPDAYVHSLIVKSRVSSFFSPLDYRITDSFGFLMNRPEDLVQGIGWNLFAHPGENQRAGEFVRSLKLG
jgi:hypothetical protein